MVDIRDLKSHGDNPCGFKSRPWYLNYYAKKDRFTNHKVFF